MIALNELLENFDEYQNTYHEMGLKTKLNTFIVLENKRKLVQNDFENTRSECNKLCKTVAEKRKNNEDTSELISKITKLDKQNKKLEKQLMIQGKIIDKKLKKLRNLPDTLNKKHLQIKTQKTPSTVSELISHLGTICKTEHSELKVQEYLETQKNKLFKEKDLPCMTVCKDGLLLLCTATKRGEFCTGIIEYLKNNSLSLVKHSIYKMKKSSSSEYFVHLKRKTYLRVAFKKEFYTRALKIKYRDSSVDMTKFVNQINILF